MDMARPLRLLTFSTLFPDSARPSHGVFVEHRLRHLVASGHATSTVLAPVPWFPSTNPRFGTYARYAAVPRFEHRHGLDVHHPRYAVLPAIGMNIAPHLLYAAVRPALARLIRRGLQFDALDAHSLYPDGVVALVQKINDTTLVAYKTIVNALPAQLQNIFPQAPAAPAPMAAVAAAPSTEAAPATEAPTVTTDPTAVPVPEISASTIRPRVIVSSPPADYAPGKTGLLSGNPLQLPAPKITNPVDVVKDAVNSVVNAIGGAVNDAIKPGNHGSSRTKAPSDSTPAN